MAFDPVLIGSSEDPYRFGTPVHIVPAARRRHLALFGASGVRARVRSCGTCSPRTSLPATASPSSIRTASWWRTFWRTISPATGRTTLSISILRTGPALLHSTCSTAAAKGNVAWLFRTSSAFSKSSGRIPSVAHRAAASGFHPRTAEAPHEQELPQRGARRSSQPGGP
jgi:hypothetical protein